MAEELADRLRDVKRRISAACGRCGRDPNTVHLVTVAKTYGPERVREAADVGLTVIGENRVQEARQKIPDCPGHLEWHLIGHLQRNKVRLAAELFHMIHSVDSLRLLETIDRVCGEIGKVMPLCLEVNVSGESSKKGMPPEDLPDVLEQCRSLMNLDVIGLMTMPPFTENPEDARPFFQKLRTLRDESREKTGFELPDLSMGMSNDFEVAIEEGATWIRLGTLLFGSRD